MSVLTIKERPRRSVSMSNVVDFNDYKEGLIDLNLSVPVPDAVIEFDDPDQYISALEYSAYVLSIPYPIFLTGIHTSMYGLIRHLSEVETGDEEDSKTLLICLDRLDMVEEALAEQGVEIEIQYEEREQEEEDSSNIFSKIKDLVTTKEVRQDDKDNSE